MQLFLYNTNPITIHERRKAGGNSILQSCIKYALALKCPVYLYIPSFKKDGQKETVCKNMQI